DEAVAGLQLVPPLEPHERVFNLPVELLRVHRQEGRATRDAGHVWHVDVGKTGREFRDVDAANPQRFGGVRPEVRLERERHRLRVPGAQFVDQGGRDHPRVIESRTVRGQAGILNAGHKRSEIETRGRFWRRREATRRLALWRIELELAPVEADVERILIGDPVIDAAREHVVSDVTIDGGRVVVEVPGAVRQRVDTRDVSADRVDLVLRNDVAGVLIPQELCVGGADRFGRIKVRIRPRRERIVYEDEVAARVAKVAEVTVARQRGWHRVHEYLTALLFQPRVIGEKERSVVSVVDAGYDQRTADGAAELMAIERRNRILLQPAA